MGHFRYLSNGDQQTVFDEFDDLAIGGEAEVRLSRTASGAVGGLRERAGVRFVLEMDGDFERVGEIADDRRVVSVGQVRRTLDEARARVEWAAAGDVASSLQL